MAEVWALLMRAGEVVLSVMIPNAGACGRSCPFIVPPKKQLLEPNCARCNKCVRRKVRHAAFPEFYNLATFW